MGDAEAEASDVVGDAELVAGDGHDAPQLLAVEKDETARHPVSEVDVVVMEESLHQGPTGVIVEGCSLALGPPGHDEARPSLSVEQRQMVDQLCRSGRPVEVVIGRAGAGKTFTLDVVREAFEASGHRGDRREPGGPGGAGA